MFSNDDLIHSYTRAEALADGELIDVSATAREAGIRWPVALTLADNFVAASNPILPAEDVPDDRGGQGAGEPGICFHLHGMPQGGCGVATWRLAGGQVALEPFARLSRANRTALEADAGDVLRFLTPA